MTTLEFINETLEYYKTNDFGYEPTLGCVYREEAENIPGHPVMCAIGRNLPWNDFSSADYNYFLDMGSISHMMTDEFNDISDYLPEISDIEFEPRVFWAKIQTCHDKIAIESSSDENDFKSHLEIIDLFEKELKESLQVPDLCTKCIAAEI